ncbi:MAG: hemolysin family protein [Sphaerochaetaceae bacterium]|nr:hemolysin family protein [Sphaerochaetaceae bacterium]MDC7237168.1 hemolysin family protein [Sphaerochaetaceae bacterium]MDC7249073.1 hemolysin family protein [Sphaerochaetaceae bacterium]
MVNEIVIIIVLIILSGVFSSTETAYTALSLIQIKELEKSKKKSSRLAAKLTQRKDVLLTTILIGNNVVNISVSSLVTTFCIKYLGQNLVAYGTGILTLVILIFGEVTPKQIAISNAKKIAKVMSYPIFFLSKILYPLVFIIKAFGNIVDRVFNKGKTKGLTLEGLMHVVDAAEDFGVVDEYESDLMLKVLHFSNNPIKTIMTHRKDVFTVSAQTTIREAFEDIVNSGYSRIPIYKDSKENIVGIVLVRDILKAQLTNKLDEPLSSIKREPIFVLETKHVDYVFFLFKKRRLQLAIVIDEYGGFSGVISMEDVAEQLLGEIYDEHEKSEGESIKEVKGVKDLFIIQGDTPFIYFCDEMDISYKNAEKVGTIAAYIMGLTGDIPKEKDSISDEYGVYTILKMDERRIEEIKFNRVRDSF